MSNKNTIIIIIVAAVLLLALIIGLILFFTLGNDEPPRPQGGIYYDPDADNFDPNKEQYQGEKAPGVAIPGFGSWTIPPKVTKVVTDFFNPESNKDKYDLKFEVWIPKDINDLEKGYEVVYESGLVKAGKHIQEVTLERGFEKGTYDAILHVQPYTADEYHTPLNNANVKFQLLVK